MTKDEMIMKVFFTYAWQKRTTKCECGCGNKLPKEINTTCMDHILEKSRYPACKYSISNIAFYTAECHARKTNGNPNALQVSKAMTATENYDNLCKESSKFEETVKNKIWGKQ